MTVYQLPTGDWTRDAACRNKPVDWFHPEYPAHTATYARARAVCAQCPIVDQCLAYAIVINTEFGMWGATTPRERRAIRINPATRIRYDCPRCNNVIEHALIETRGFRHMCPDCRRERNLEYHTNYRRRRPA